ncbi:putative bifunctional diguanylate cyclase/phosphodiesterase [Azospirillum thermophilum]|nr:EAL domain-containing protein [Azospirillum thermophilum]
MSDRPIPAPGPADDGEAGRSPAIPMDLRRRLAGLHGDAVLTVAADGRVLDSQPAFPPLDWSFTRPDGTEATVELTMVPVPECGGAARLAVARDVSARRLIEQRMLLSEQKFAKLFAISPDPMIVSEIATGRILDVNLSFCTTFGFSREEVLGRSTIGIGLWNDPQQRADTVAQMRRQGQLRNHEVEFRAKDGRLISVQGSSAEVVIEGRPCWLVQFKDITESKAHLAMVEFLAHHDSLTGLPNRKRLHEAVTDRILRDGETNGGFALMLIDLDRFKEINDTLGHHVGDELLRLVAARLQETAALRTGFVSRLGGDEFAVLLPDEGVEQAKSWAADFLSLMRQPFALEGLRIEVGASIGIAVYPIDGRDSSTLLRCADVAMYIAKRKQTGYSHYIAQADTHSATRLALMAELGEAMRAGHLCLHYQPILRVREGTVSGMEALVRWQHPLYGLIPPGDFVPMAEMSDQIHDLTGWVLNAAVAQAVTWRQSGHRWRMAVNLSARNLINDGLPDLVRAVLEQHGLPPGRLELEITETAMMADPDRALSVLTRIADLGVEIAIDDFGTGYSSFTTLRRLPPVATLKIDQSFVRRMLGGRRRGGGPHHDPAGEPARHPRRRRGGGEHRAAGRPAADRLSGGAGLCHRPPDGGRDGRALVPAGTLRRRRRRQARSSSCAARSSARRSWLRL